jgi:hypothetical protein
MGYPLDPVNDILGRAAKSLAEEEKSNAVKQRAYENVREGLTRNISGIDEGKKDRALETLKQIMPSVIKKPAPKKPAVNDPPCNRCTSARNGPALIHPFGRAG